MPLLNPPITKDSHTDVAERLPASGQPSDSQQGSSQSQQVTTNDGQVVNLGLNSGNRQK